MKKGKSEKAGEELSEEEEEEDTDEEEEKQTGDKIPNPAEENGEQIASNSKIHSEMERAHRATETESSPQSLMKRKEKEDRSEARDIVSVSASKEDSDDTEESDSEDVEEGDLWGAILGSK